MRIMSVASPAPSSTDVCAAPGHADLEDAVQLEDASLTLADTATAGASGIE